MTVTAGTFLISAPTLEDPNFEKVVIYITEHNSKGAAGFVINKVFSRRFNELVEFKWSLPINLYEGGPVEKESLFFLHRSPGSIAEGTPVANGIYMGGNFKAAVTQMNQAVLTARDIKLFIGYCGWDDDELETEIREGSWLIVTTSTDTIFAQEVDTLWDILHRPFN